VTELPKSTHEPANKEPIVFVIDDDASMRRALTNLFESTGLKVEVFGSAPEMLDSKLPDVASCLVLDIRLPGLDFQTELAKANIHIPIIFMTGHGDIPMTVRAMKGGAVDFLTKPFRDQDMLDAVGRAIERDRSRREADKIVANLQMPAMSGLDLLTHMRAQGYNAPFIFITAFPDESVRARALKAGAICFLAKPFAGRSLISCIETVVNGHRGGK
jgi:FixJ family two-component response regulator